MAIIIPLVFSSSTTTALLNPIPAHRFLASFRPRPRPANYCIANIQGYVFCCSSSSSVQESTSISVVSSNRQSYETRKWNLDELLKHLDREPAPGDSNPDKMELKEFEMVAEYGTVPAALWHSFTKRLCNSGNYVAATKVLNWVRKHNLCYSYELMYSIIIHGISKAGRLYEAFLLADELREQGKPLGALTYNALLGACARNDEYEKALNLLSRMRQEGLQPDIVNYSLVIQALTRANADSCVVINLYEDMKSEGFELDANCLMI